jgi:hypothetical protein
MKIAKDKAEKILQRLAISIRKKHTPGPHSPYVYQQNIFDPDFLKFVVENNLRNPLKNFRFDSQLSGSVFYCECTYLGSLYSFLIKDLDGNILSRIDKNYPNSTLGNFHFYAVRTNASDLVEKTPSFDGKMPLTEKIEVERWIFFDFDFDENEDEVQYE